MAVEFPRPRLGALQALGARLHDSRKVGTPLETLGRDLLAGFYDICMAAGLDRVLVELEQAFPELDISDRTGLAEHPTLFPALIAQLRAIELDGGGPRNAKPLQLADCLVAALGLTLVDDTQPATNLDDTVRTEVLAALARVIDVELAVPRIREAIIATARAQCLENHLGAFDKLAAQLDPRGLKLLKQPKVPLDAVQAVQRLLADARTAVIGGAASAAIDGAKAAIARADADVAARIDLPVTHRLTPREVAMARACDERIPKTPQAIASSVLESLSELARFAWRSPERAARPYAASQTFAVGDLIDHPKFGRGSVISRYAQRIEVEFPEGKFTLVHVGPK